MDNTKLKLILKDKIKAHKEAINHLTWKCDKWQVEIKVKVYEEILEVINGHNTA